MRKRSKHIGASKSFAWWELGPMWPQGLGTKGYTFNSLFTFHRRCVLKIILLSVAYFLLLIKTKTLWFEHCSKATACVWFLTNSKWFPNLNQQLLMGDVKVGPCCSRAGWCGNTSAHCDCPECIDYRQVIGRCLIFIIGYIIWTCFTFILPRSQLWCGDKRKRGNDSARGMSLKMFPTAHYLLLRAEDGGA